MAYKQEKSTQLQLGLYCLIQLCKHEISCLLICKHLSVTSSDGANVSVKAWAPYNSFLWIKQQWLGSKDQGSINAPPCIMQSKPRDQTPVISIVPYCVDDRVSPWPTLTRRAICRVTDGPGSVSQVPTFRRRVNLIWSRGGKKGETGHVNTGRDQNCEVIILHHTPQAPPQVVYCVL